MEEKSITCIGCPLGCEIAARVDGARIEALSGYGCKRGEIYARAELTDPRRTLTTTMRVQGGGLVSVKSAAPLPKDALPRCMAAVNTAQALTPVEIGDVLLRDICGLGVDIVATSRAKGV